MVLNAACEEKDLAFLRKYQQEFNNSGKQVELTKREGALIAVQGPKAEAVLKELSSEASVIENMLFMNTKQAIDIAGVHCNITRCGYTGEDGFEVH